MALEPDDSLSAEEVDARWKDILANLDDPGSIDMPAEHASFSGIYSSHTNSTPNAPEIHHGLGPRDWTPGEPSDEGEPFIPAVPATVTNAPIPLKRALLWLFPAVLLLFALISTLGYLPGGPWLAGLCVIGACVGVALALWASSPSADTIDPDDDGARV